MADISDHTLRHCCQGLARFTRQSGRHFIKNSAIDFWLNIGLKNGFLRVVFKLDMKIYKMESLILKFMKNCLTYLSNVEKILFHYFFLNFKAASPSLFRKKYFFSCTVLLNKIADFSSVWQRCHTLKKLRRFFLCFSNYSGTQ